MNTNFTPIKEFLPIVEMDDKWSGSVIVEDQFVHCSYQFVDGILDRISYNPKENT
jgi:hypothetical protein